LWDDDASVWIATSADIPGLCCEAETFEALVEIVAGLAPDLLLANGLTPDRKTITLDFQAQRYTIVKMAA